MRKIRALAFITAFTLSLLASGALASANPGATLSPPLPPAPLGISWE